MHSREKKNHLQNHIYYQIVSELMGLGIREISKLILLPLYKSILGSGFRSDSVIILSNKHAN